MRIGCPCSASFATLTPIIEVNAVMVDVYINTWGDPSQARLPADLLVIQEFLDKNTPRFGCLRARMFKDLKAKLEALMAEEIEPLLHELREDEREDLRSKYAVDLKGLKLEYVDNPACKDYSTAKQEAKVYTLG